jgi:SOS response regulatory protein OraA/RecX
MSVTIELDLPEGVIDQARQMGLLDNRRVAEWLADEVRRRNAGQELKKVLEGIRSAPGEPLPMNEIGDEIKAARAERRAREAGR